MYGVAHTSTIPTVSVTAGPTYATQINAAISELRATVDAKVTPAGMDINANLSFLSGGTYSAAIDLGRVNFQNRASTIAAASNPVALFAANGELYYNDNSSRQIQVTNAGALNLSATGGITGSGYGSAGVEVNWNTANTEYRFKSGSGADDFAHIKANDLLLNDGSGNFIRFASPAIASDYTVTWPTAVPASTLPVLMASDGTLSASGTLANLVTFTTSGNGTVGGTLTSTGLITATAGVTAAANQHVTVSGTGRFKHGSMERIIPGPAAISADWTISYAVNATGASWLYGSGGAILFPLDFAIGTRITQIDVFARFDGTTSKTLGFRQTDGTTLTSQTAASTTDFGATPGYTISLVLSPQVTIANGNMYYVSVSGGDVADLIFHVKVAYDFP